MNDVPATLRDILSHTSLFKMLDSRQLDEIAASTNSLRTDSHTCVVNQGDIADGVFWVVYGQVKIAFCTSQGGEKTIEILGPYTCFGVGEMLLEKPHLAYVKTTCDSLLLHTRSDTIMQVAQENFGFARELMNCVGRQFYGLVRDIESYSQSARQRLAGYLLSQSRHEGRQEFELVGNKVLISSRLSLAPETLSRLLHDFVAEGLIEIAGRNIKILDLEKISAA